jgi:two-component system, NtrC family, response regulator AtoC
MLAHETLPAIPAGGRSQKLRVLLVEDEELFARAVARRLEKAGYQCELAQSVADGRALVRQFSPDLVLLDMRLPDGNGLELLGELTVSGIPVIVMTAHGDVSDAVNAMKQGATDYLKKPVDLDELLLTIEKVQRTAALNNSLDHSRERDSRAVDGVGLLGDSPAMQSVRAQIEQIARLSSLAEAIPPTVLITGETGTGKDVAARLLHQLGNAAQRPFVQVDCASLPGELIESELFGHEKGAYTSAQGARCGLIEAAEDGTLFLDEVGELPLALQAKLLNVLERRMVRRLGSTKERPVPARFVAATNRDLQQMVIEGRFRADLFYRLHVLTISMPPLRDRAQDELLLARFFLSQTERRYGLATRQLTPDATAALTGYNWPGNVRELKHLIGRAALLSKASEISAADLGLSSTKTQQRTQTEPMVDGLTIDAAERLLMEEALRSCAGNVSEAARRLGLTRMAMRYRMQKHGLKES